MSLPNVFIDFQNGNIGSVRQSNDGVFGLIIGAEAVVDKFQLNKPYLIKSLEQLIELGILPAIGTNYKLYKTVKEFYQEAGTGTELWILGVSTTKTLSHYVTEGTVNTLLQADPRISGVFFVRTQVGATSVVNGLDQQVYNVLPLAQSAAETSTTLAYKPIFIIIDGFGFSGVPTDLTNLTTFNYNRVGVLIGDTESRTGATASQGSAIGILAGRLANTQVHQNIGKVKLGALTPLQMYVKDNLVESADVEMIHDKGFITFRTLPGKAGYFFSDDPLACEVEDDYHYLTRRRVADKAYKLCYQVLVNYLLDEIPVTNEGKISPTYAKGIQGHVERVIAQEMSAKGELSVDVTKKDDQGVKCYIDLNQNVVSTSELQVQVSIRPHGYNRFINVLLGYQVNL